MAGASPGQADYARGLKALKGDGVPRDPRAAAGWIRRAAEAGHAPGQYALGRLLLRGAGLEVNRDEALLWLRRAHAQGYARATQQLRELGVPLQAPPPAGPRPGAWPVRSPIVLPVKPASEVVSEMLLHLEILGGALNEPLLFRTRLNAERGSPFHQFHLGYLHETGHLVEKDRDKARSWYTKSAAGGYPPAQAFLARLEATVARERGP